MIQQAQTYAQAGVNVPIDPYLGQTQTSLFTDIAANQQEAQSMLHPHFKRHILEPPRAVTHL